MSVESLSFRAEFIAMKQCCEYSSGLRYKLQMMGIPVEAPIYVYGDNQTMLTNTTQSIAYHFVHEGAVRDEWHIAYVNTHDNEADLLTKLLPSGKKHNGFVQNLLH